MDLLFALVIPLVCYGFGWYVGYATAVINQKIKAYEPKKVAVKDLRPRD